MKRFSSLVAVAVAVLVVVSVPMQAQQQQPPTQQQPSAQTEKTFEGDLSKVDANAKTLSVKGPGGAEMVFTYSDSTRILGPEKTIEGLAGKSGSGLKVSYHDQGGRNMATQIEMVAKKP